MGVIARRRCKATENAVANITGVVGYSTGSQSRDSTIEAGRTIEQEYRRTAWAVEKLGDLSSATTGAE